MNHAIPIVPSAMINAFYDIEHDIPNQRNIVVVSCRYFVFPRPKNTNGPTIRVKAS